jgi:Zn-finger protein
MSEYYKFFQNSKCEYFPCHKGVKEEDFNCLFCYCPLYMLGEDCGGNFSYTHGIKDCSKCTIPHEKNSYNYIMRKMDLVINRTMKKD